MGFLDQLKQWGNTLSGEENPSSFVDDISRILQGKQSLMNKTKEYVRPLAEPEKEPRWFDEESKRVWEEALAREEAKKQQMQVPREAEALEVTKDPKMIWSGEQASQDIDPKIVEYAENKLFKESDKWNMPRPLSISQWAIEGGRDVSDSQANSFGMGGAGNLLDYGDYAGQVKAHAQTVADIASTNMGSPIDVSDDEAVRTFLGSHDVEDILYHLQFQSNGEPGIKRYEDSLLDESGNYSPQLYIDMVHNMPEWRYYR